MVLETLCAPNCQTNKMAAQSTFRQFEIGSFKKTRNNLYLFLWLTEVCTNQSVRTQAIHNMRQLHNINDSQYRSDSAEPEPEDGRTMHKSLG